MKRYTVTNLPPATQPLNNGEEVGSPKDKRTYSMSNDDFALEAEREIQKALESFASQNNTGIPKLQDGGMRFIDSQKQVHTHLLAGSIQAHGGNVLQQFQSQTIPQPPDQSEPTQVLYEKARQATIAKAPGNARRPGLPSQRRPWSQEEESALMAGLDLVKGPHWSQILALYGPEGTVNNILKDRNQVQLKDKARNLKLFFLKSNTEVPHYLQAVTGELKTRAPTQAARKEAEERARLASADEQMRVNGIMALSSIKDHSHSNGRTEQSPSLASDITLSSSQDLEYEEKLDVVGEEKYHPDSPQSTVDERLLEHLSAHNSGIQ